MQDSKDQLPLWIKDIQNQSWQIEILIASGLIYFLYQLPLFYRNEFVEHIQSADISVEAVILLFAALTFTKALLIGFVVNLLLRALWLAYLGVNFSFPKGVNYENLGYSDYFKSKDQQMMDTPSRIVRLEKYCSLSYSFSIFLSIMSLGIFLLLNLIISLVYYISPVLYDTADFGYFLLIVLSLLMLGGLDFLIFKFFKKRKRLSRWYYPFYRFFNFISLAFLFKKEWHTLLSNIKRWKIHAVFFAYLLIAIIMAMDEISSFLNVGSIPKISLSEKRIYTKPLTDKYVRRTYYNQLLQADDKVIYGCIEKEIIRENHMYVYVVYWQEFDEDILVFAENNGFINDRSVDMDRNVFEKNNQAFQNTLSDFFDVKIDQTPIDSISWFFAKHAQTKELGFKGYFSIKDIPPGIHRLKVNCKYVAAKDSILSYPRLNIPFVKD